MTEIKEVSTEKETPRVANRYYIGDGYTVDMALAAFEKKYGVKPVTAVLYKSYLYVEKEA